MRLTVRRHDDLADGQSEGIGEFPVAGLVRRHGHDRACAIRGQDVVGNPDWDPFGVGRVDGVCTGEDAGLFARALLPLQLRASPRLSPICLNL